MECQLEDVTGLFQFIQCLQRLSGQIQFVLQFVGENKGLYGSSLLDLQALFILVVHMALWSK